MSRLNAVAGMVACQGKLKVRRIRTLTTPADRHIHFLHIGKCGGTQVSYLARQITDQGSKMKIVIHGHYDSLRDLPPEARYFFSIRNPFSRYLSGFYSRKRRGRPRFNVAWSPHDEVAFSRFEHANDLAESLFEPGDLGREAWGAIKSIIHTAQNQSDWFAAQGNFLVVRPPVWILRQERFSSDLKVFLERSGVGLGYDDLDISTDSKIAHANNYDGVPALSEKAKRNLRRWYAQDFGFYDMCDHWLEQGGPAGTRSSPEPDA